MTTRVPHPAVRAAITTKVRNKHPLERVQRRDARRRRCGPQHERLLARTASEVFDPVELDIERHGSDARRDDAQRIDELLRQAHMIAEPEQRDMQTIPRNWPSGQARAFAQPRDERLDPRGCVFVGAKREEQPVGRDR